MYTSDEKDKADKRKLRSVIMIAAGVLLLVVGVLLIVLAPALSGSKGIMPDVIGVDRDKARALLEKRGLEVIEIEVEDDNYGENVVIEQSIEPGEKIEPGMVVKLTVNISKNGSAGIFGSAPPMESVDPDDADADSLERNKGGNGGYSGGGNNGTGGNKGNTGDNKGNTDGNTGDNKGNADGNTGGNKGNTDGNNVGNTTIDDGKVGTDLGVNSDENC